MIDYFTRFDSILTRKGDNINIEMEFRFMALMSLFENMFNSLESYLMRQKAHSEQQIFFYWQLFLLPLFLVKNIIRRIFGGSVDGKKKQ